MKRFKIYVVPQLLFESFDFEDIISVSNPVTTTNTTTLPGSTGESGTVQIPGGSGDAEVDFSGLL